MPTRLEGSQEGPGGRRDGRSLPGFRSETLDRVRAAGNVWDLPGGQVLLPRAFGFCRGVERALEMLEEELDAHARHSGRLCLLGQIIHNPWVNDYFRHRGVRILTAEELANFERFVGSQDCAVIPAFGVPLPIERRLRAIRCRVVDTSCPDVRRLWRWAERAVKQGCGILIFGRSRHDETVVTKSRLAAAGGRYLVANDLEQTRRFCNMVTGAEPAGTFTELFGADATNADGLEPFSRLAQVSQTTMLYDETMKVRELLRSAYEQRYGRGGGESRLLFEPTVCRATQQRQSAAIELCKAGCDLVIVVGGFGSSNTRHLFELASTYAPALFIEDAAAIRSREELRTFDQRRDEAVVVRDWLPARRPVRIGILAGASSPEIVVGRVLERLAGFLS